MIDSVLKGTGNSRFLKSAVPAGTSWADALAMLQAGTFPIDFNGINTEGFQQVGTPLNKANLLKDATAAQIGLPPSTTPDGMFQALGNTGELHVWRKTVTTAQEIPAGYTLGASAAKTLAKSSENSGNSYATFYISSSISVDDAGNVTMDSPATVDIWQGIDVHDSDERAILGKFIKFHSVSSSNAGITSDLETGIYFIPNSAEFTRYRDGRHSGYTNISACQKVNTYPLTPAGTTTTYPVSTNPNAYQEGDDAKAAGYTLGEVETGSFQMAGSNSSGYVNTFQGNDTVKVSDDGSISIGTESGFVSVSVDRTSSGQRQARTLVGKFIQNDSYIAGDFLSGETWFIPTDATISDYVYVNKRQRVTGYAAIPAGTTIEYLGKLGDKARVQVGSYVGTGTFGASNPCSITANFKIKFAVITNVKSNSADVSGTAFFLPFALNKTYTRHAYAMFDYDGGNQNQYKNAKKSKDGKTLYWYNQQYAEDQMNVSGRIYFYVLFG